MSKKAAEQFAVLVMAQFGAEFQSPIVTSGTAYEYITEEEHGQVFELYADANWEAFVSPENDEHHIIRRVTQRGGSDAASTG